MFKLMFLGGLILAVICLILSIVLFIKNDVAKLLADVTGLSAKKAVKRMKNEKTSDDSEQKPANKLKGFIQNLKVEKTAILLDNAMKPEMAVEKKSVKGIDSKVTVPEKKANKEQVENIFQPEEEMLVLAGRRANRSTPVSKEEKETALSEISEVLRGGPIRLAHSDNADPMSEVDGILFGKENKPVSKKDLQKADSGVLSGEATEVLDEGERLTDILESGATDILPNEEKPTDILKDTATDILTDSLTDVLKDTVTDILTDSSTDVLKDTATDTLRSDSTSRLPGISDDIFNNYEEDDFEDMEEDSEEEDITDVLALDDDEDSDESETTEVLWTEDEASTDVLLDESTELLYDEDELQGILSSDSTTLLQPEIKRRTVLSKTTSEEQPLPAIFDVQDTATIVHTEEKIGTTGDK